MKNGQAVIGLQPGALDQIKLGRAEAFPGFHIRSIASNGIIWTGARNEAHTHIPKGAVADFGFDENPFSNVLNFAHSRFKYYTGDNTSGAPHYTQHSSRVAYTQDNETTAPRACEISERRHG